MILTFYGYSFFLFCFFGGVRALKHTHTQQQQQQKMGVYTPLWLGTLLYALVAGVGCGVVQFVPQCDDKRFLFCFFFVFVFDFVFCFCFCFCFLFLFFVWIFHPTKNQKTQLLQLPPPTKKKEKKEKNNNISQKKRVKY